MLTELRIRNYAVIEDLELRPEPGLNVLTGETGAGKSIIVGALSLLLGERASSELVRAGEESAFVEAVFDIGGRPETQDRCTEAGIEAEEGWLVVKRQVQAGGRSRAWVNGSPATVGLLGELGELLVDLHGQHEHQTLLHAGPQREILDAYGGCTDRAEELAETHSALRALRGEIADVEDRRTRVEERADLLRHQAEEIEAAELEDPEEDLRLAEEERRLSHAEELLERSDHLHNELYASESSIHDRLGKLSRSLEALAKLDPAIAEELEALLDTAYYNVEELANRVMHYRDEIDLSPSRLEAVRRRIDRLFRLKSKYGPGLDDVMAAGERARQELDALDTAGLELEKLRKREEELQGQLERQGAELTEQRSKAAGRLSEEVTGLLPELGMPDGVFEVRLTPLESIASHGGEDVEFRVTLNRGFEPRALSKVASGGELSRVMLALKTILAKLDRTPTLIFDEIDAGIGGVVGQKVAQRLKAVAEHHQVFVITHLPQIAALADHHLLVYKRSQARKTSTEVSELLGPDRVRDIARMLGGDPEREESLEHARALLGG